MNEPAATCSIIDEWLKDIQRSHTKAQYNLTELLDNSISALEEMRNLNQELRDWGKNGWDQVEELEDTIEDLNQKIKELS